MARRKQLAISERQFEVLNLLWEHGPMTVREIRERLDRAADLPYTTVLGLLQVMERERLVVHEEENQTHRFRPSLSRREGTSQLLTDFVRRFFCGAAEKLVLGLVDAQQFSADDLRELEARLATKAPATYDRQGTPVKPVGQKAGSPAKRSRKKP
jgi:predicted transcriptional regulator